MDPRRALGFHRLMRDAHPPPWRDWARLQSNTGGGLQGPASTGNPQLHVPLDLDVPIVWWFLPTGHTQLSGFR